MALESLKTSTACPEDAAGGWSGNESGGNLTSQKGWASTSLRDMRAAASFARQRASRSLKAEENLGSRGGGACMTSSRSVLKFALMYGGRPVSASECQ
jgi:hypothetical protein